MNKMSRAEPQGNTTDSSQGSLGQQGSSARGDSAAITDTEAAWLLGPWRETHRRNAGNETTECLSLSDSTTRVSKFKSLPSVERARLRKLHPS